MAESPLTDAHDPRLDPFRGLRESERAFMHPPPAGTRAPGRFVAEGGRIVARAIGAGYTPEAILVDAAVRERLGWCDDPALPIVVAEREAIRAATGLAVIREAVGIFARPDAASAAAVIAGAERILVLEGVANPVNLGVIIRSAAALGVDATLLDPRCTDPLYRRSVRGSMGAALTHPWARIEALPAGIAPVREAGATVIALVTDRDAAPLDHALRDAGPRVALVLGAEGDGISPAGRAAVDRRATIPMDPGIDSLNVGAAAAVACYLLGALSPRRRT